MAAKRTPDDSKSDLRRTCARERRFMAIHEAGHLVVGQHFGRCHGRPRPVARIYRNEDRGSQGRTWYGQTEIYDIDLMDPIQQRMIACAGTAATCLWDKRELHASYWKDPSFMSPTDWELAECVPGEPDHLCTVAITRLSVLLHREGPLWTKVQIEARRLIVEARSPSTAFTQSNPR